MNTESVNKWLDEMRCKAMENWFDSILKVDRLMYLISRTKNKRIQNKLLKRIEKLNAVIFGPDY